MATFDLKSLSKADLWTVFKHFDTHNKGSITYKSLIRAYKRTGRSNSEDEVLELMRELNMEKDDELTFDKFCSALMNNTVNGSQMDLSISSQAMKKE